jgi:ATP-dependent DNA helicase RecG
MLSREELLSLNSDLESDRVERTMSISNTDKFSEAICAFSNDFPNHKRPGYLVIGVDDKTGAPSGLAVTDELLKNLAAIRNNGQILPQPSITVQKYTLDAGDIAVVEVFPGQFPPIRYKGRVWIRNGPVKAIANETEERMLTEKRTSSAKTFDAQPAAGSKPEDLNYDSIRHTYLPSAIAPEILEQNHRDFEQQIASLRLLDFVYRTPTNAGILLFGFHPQFFLPGAYIQYLKFDGIEMTPHPKEKAFSGPLITELKMLNDFIRYSVIEERSVRGETMQETQSFNYPFWAIRELVMNAVMHRNYESNAPVYIYHYTDRIEIINSGGLSGEARPDNFPNAHDYRNPVIAEAMKILGYVNRFNYGVRQAQKELAVNANPPAEFKLDLVTKFMVTIRISEHWKP